ncbi:MULTISPECIES: DUF433 domain-containing protein [unclassified Microcoleus]|uniref:DUF433 domain-containing protein n=1 Tax=unclassified Microcoleus TaxID=2642155 RepID=UPI002FD6612B
MQRITIAPNIGHGKPFRRGLRYLVESILELLSYGMNSKEIIDDYDDLSQKLGLKPRPYRTALLAEVKTLNLFHKDM